MRVYFQGLIRLSVDRSFESLKQTIEAIEAARYRTVHLLVCELLLESWARTDFNTLIEFLRQIYSRTYEPVGTRIVLTLPELTGCESPALYSSDLDVLYECSYSEQLNSEEVNRVRAQRGLKLVEQECLVDISLIPPFDLEFSEPVTAPLFSKTALGGTFDYLHAAHMLLLTIQSLLTEKEVVVGITTDSLLQNKRHPCFIQSFTE
jgi:phosphopantetheine adenylyltransferase